MKSILLSLGPGIITAALVSGPSKMTTTSKFSGQYGGCAAYPHFTDDGFVKDLLSPPI